ncbi:MAG: 23S rRNA (adenine(2503)-C(2))-methyltransferase RlmN [Acidimicrobiia bacterium]
MPYLTAPEDLSDLLPEEPRYRTDQVCRWLYRNPVLDAENMTNLPLALRKRLSKDLWPFTVETEHVSDAAATRKWLFRAPGGASIETVLMGYPKRATLCISSQAGCAMGCTFCATGQFGFERHLRAGEIVAQVAYAAASLRDHPMVHVPDHITNVVFMGMGEPLANYGNVAEALRRMIDVMGMSARSITISTVGVVPGIDRLTASGRKVNLAVSLHGASDEVRSRLVPLNERYDLESIIAACRRYFDMTGRRISIEWTLIRDKNDTEDQAHRLAEVARRLRAHVNVIALNPTPLSPDQPPRAPAIRRFMTTLSNDGINATLRDTRGRDIDAACGQLRVRAATDHETEPGSLAQTGGVG